MGGPARHIAAHSKAHVTGVNMNAYQIDRARKHTSKANLSHLVEFVEVRRREIKGKEGEGRNYVMEREMERKEAHCDSECVLGVNLALFSTQADFMHMPFEDNSFDAAYAFEAVCHAPDKVHANSLCHAHNNIPLLFRSSFSKTCFGF